VGDRNGEKGKCSIVISRGIEKFSLNPSWGRKEVARKYHLFRWIALVGAAHPTTEEEYFIT
jgi:hypothetical protein